jgi:outer membrane protein insertion porin family
MNPHAARTRQLVRLLLVTGALGAILAAAPARGFERLRFRPYPELEGRVVRQVLIFGNNHTDPVVLTREMGTREGEAFSSEELWRDWERLVDLGIFAELEVEAVPSGDGVLVVVSVYERPRWFAAPVADYDLDDGEISVGYRLRLRNFDGLNRSFRSKGVFGPKGRVTATWESPWLGDRRMPVFVDLRHELPREDDQLRSSHAGVGVTRYFGDYKRVRTGLTGYGRLEKLDRSGTHPGGPVDQLSPVVGTIFSRDDRNVRIDPTRGSLFSAGTELISGWATDDLSYLRSILDGRIFLATGRGTVLAARGVTVVTTGDIPDFRLVGVGGGGSIRGQPSSVEVGKNLARASIEWRFPLLARRRFVLPIPLVPRKISNVDLRIDGEFFVDAGTAWDDSVGFRSARIRPGAGFGLRVFLPVLELARIELAFDPSGTPRAYFREGNLI